MFSFPAASFVLHLMLDRFNQLRWPSIHSLISTQCLSDTAALATSRTGNFAQAVFKYRHFIRNSQAPQYLTDSVSTVSAAKRVSK